VLEVFHTASDPNKGGGDARTSAVKVYPDRS